MFAKESRGSARRAPKPPRRQKIARAVTIHAKPKPRHRRQQVHHYNPPPVYHAPKPARRQQQHHYNPPKRNTYHAPARHSGGGGGNHRPRNQQPARQGRIQGPGRQNARPAPKPKPKPRIPGVGQYLNQDAAYRTGTSELMRALNQFKSSNANSKGDVKEAFKTAMERMGEEKTKSLQSLQEDFASRGLLTSGLYTDSVSDYNEEFGKRTEDLNKDQRNQLENLNEEFTNFSGLNKSKAAELRLDAIRRRAEKYGLRA